jgi:calcium/calmodulin-dependent protein kinase I
MVHRDLKPSNIVIDDPNDLSSVRIADFGLAVKLKDRSELLSTCGTLIYQSPEQIFGTTKQGRSVDIFAIGFILYEVLTRGKHPILLKGEDKQAYRQKMKGFTGLNLEGHGLSPLA